MGKIFFWGVLITRRETSRWRFAGRYTRGALEPTFFRSACAWPVQCDFLRVTQLACFFCVRVAREFPRETRPSWARKRPTRIQGVNSLQEGKKHPTKSPSTPIPKSTRPFLINPLSISAVTCARKKSIALIHRQERVQMDQRRS